ncbi:MAG: hypothetical protein WC523_02840 [Patescibacteria group bacterium]|jgi:hypothetical protein
METIKIIVITPDPLDEVFVFRELAKCFNPQGEVFLINSKNESSQALKSCLDKRDIDVIVLDTNHPYFLILTQKIKKNYPEIILGCFSSTPLAISGRSKEWQECFSFTFDTNQEVNLLQRMIIKALYPV